MSLILAFDTETTGINVKKDYILEVGAVVYDTDSKQMVEFYDAFVRWPSLPEITPDNFQVHGISNDMLLKHGQPWELVVGMFFSMSKRCEYVIGHNVLLYDKPILETNLHRLHEPYKHALPAFSKIKWIDTICDLPYPSHIKERKLELLCTRHRYFHQHAHRAIFDAIACLHLIGCYDFKQIQEIAATPLVTITAEVPFIRKDEAREQGFYWNPDKKLWQKSVREYYLNDLRKQAKFNIVIESAQALADQASSGPGIRADSQQSLLPFQ